MTASNPWNRRGIAQFDVRDVEQELFAFNRSAKDLFSDRRDASAEERIDVDSDGEDVEVVNDGDSVKTGGTAGFAPYIDDKLLRLQPRELDALGKARRAAHGLAQTLPTVEVDMDTVGPEAQADAASIEDVDEDTVNAVLPSGRMQPSTISKIAQRYKDITTVHPTIDDEFSHLYGDDPTVVVKDAELSAIFKAAKEAVRKCLTQAIPQHNPAEWARTLYEMIPPTKQITSTGWLNVVTGSCHTFVVFNRSRIKPFLKAYRDAHRDLTGDMNYLLETSRKNKMGHFYDATSEFGPDLPTEYYQYMFFPLVIRGNTGGFVRFARDGEENMPLAMDSRFAMILMPYFKFLSDNPCSLNAQMLSLLYSSEPALAIAAHITREADFQPEHHKKLKQFIKNYLKHTNGQSAVAANMFYLTESVCKQSSSINFETVIESFKVLPDKYADIRERVQPYQRAQVEAAAVYQNDVTTIFSNADGTDFGYISTADELNHLLSAIVGPIDLIKPEDTTVGVRQSAYGLGHSMIDDLMKVYRDIQAGRTITDGTSWLQFIAGRTVFMKDGNPQLFYPKSFKYRREHAHSSPRIDMLTAIALMKFFGPYRISHTDLIHEILFSNAPDFIYPIMIAAKTFFKATIDATKDTYGIDSWYSATPDFKLDYTGLKSVTDLLAINVIKLCNYCNSLPPPNSQDIPTLAAPIPWDAEIVLATYTADGGIEDEAEFIPPIRDQDDLVRLLQYIQTAFPDATKRVLAEFWVQHQRRTPMPSGHSFIDFFNAQNLLDPTFKVFAAPFFPFIFNVTDKPVTFWSNVAKSKVADPEKRMRTVKPITLLAFTASYWAPTVLLNSLTEMLLNEDAEQASAVRQLGTWAALQSYLFGTYKNRITSTYIRNEYKKKFIRLKYDEYQYQRYLDEEAREDDEDDVIDDDDDYYSNDKKEEKTGAGESTDVDDGIVAIRKIQDVLKKAGIDVSKAGSDISWLTGEIEPTDKSTKIDVWPLELTQAKTNIDLLVCNTLAENDFKLWDILKHSAADPTAELCKIIASRRKLSKPTFGDSFDTYKDQYEHYPLEIQLQFARNYESEGNVIELFKCRNALNAMNAFFENKANSLENIYDQPAIMYKQLKVASTDLRTWLKKEWRRNTHSQAIKKNEDRLIRNILHHPTAHFKGAFEKFAEDHKLSMNETPRLNLKGDDIGFNFSSMRHMLICALYFQNAFSKGPQGSERSYSDLEKFITSEWYKDPLHFPQGAIEQYQKDLVHMLRIFRPEEIGGLLGLDCPPTEAPKRVEALFPGLTGLMSVDKDVQLAIVNNSDITDDSAYKLDDGIIKWKSDRIIKVLLQFAAAGDLRHIKISSFEDVYLSDVRVDTTSSRTARADPKSRIATIPATLGEDKLVLVALMYRNLILCGGGRTMGGICSQWITLENALFNHPNSYKFLKTLRPHDIPWCYLRMSDKAMERYNRPGIPTANIPTWLSTLERDENITTYRSKADKEFEAMRTRYITHKTITVGELLKLEEATLVKLIENNMYINSIEADPMCNVEAPDVTRKVTCWFVFATTIGHPRPKEGRRRAANGLSLPRILLMIAFFKYGTYQETTREALEANEGARFFIEYAQCIRENKLHKTFFNRQNGTPPSFTPPIIRLIRAPNSRYVYNDLIPPFEAYEKALSTHIEIWVNKAKFGEDLSEYENAMYNMFVTRRDHWTDSVWFPSDKEYVYNDWINSPKLMTPNVVYLLWTKQPNPPSKQFPNFDNTTNLPNNRWDYARTLKWLKMYVNSEVDKVSPEFKARVDGIVPEPTVEHRAKRIRWDEETIAAAAEPVPMETTQSPTVAAPDYSILDFE